MKLNQTTLIVGALALAGAWFFFRGFRGVAKDAASAAGSLAVGAVEGIADGVFGIPQTNQTECDRAIAEGRTWDASFACPAGRFLSSIFGGEPPSTPADAYAQGTPDNPVRNTIAL